MIFIFNYIIVIVNGWPLNIWCRILCVAVFIICFDCKSRCHIRVRIIYLIIACFWRGICQSHFLHVQWQQWFGRFTVWHRWCVFLFCFLIWYRHRLNKISSWNKFLSRDPTGAQYVTYLQDLPRLLVVDIFLLVSWFVYYLVYSFDVVFAVVTFVA